MKKYAAARTPTVTMSRMTPLLMLPNTFRIASMLIPLGLGAREVGARSALYSFLRAPAGGTASGKPGQIPVDAEALALKRVALRDEKQVPVRLDLDRAKMRVSAGRLHRGGFTQ